MGDIYDLIGDYGQSTDSDAITMTPFWIVAVVRMINPSTFSRVKLASFSTDPTDGIGQRKPPLIVTSDCIKLQITGGKDSHLKNLAAVIVGSEVNYLAEVFPGDWVGAWIVNDQSKFNDLVKRIGDGDQCNGFSDGFKFLGRVANVRKTLAVDPSSGFKSVRYQVSAVGFKELDSQTFFEPGLEQGDPGTASWMARADKDLLDSLTGVGRGSVFVSANEAIPFFTNLLLGDGIPKSLSNRGGDENPELQEITGLTQQKDAPFAYIMPKIISNWMGKKSRAPTKDGGMAAYADILEMIIGLQRYTGDAIDQTLFLNNDFLKGAKKGRNPIVFIPDGVFGQGGLVKATSTPLLSQFLPQPQSFSGRTVWSALQDFLNPVINEMYTCLRMNQDGSVVPTIIVRQLPFSSNAIVGKQVSKVNDPGVANDQDEVFMLAFDSVEVTPFLELPRWKLDPGMVWHVDLGRSDSMRFNFVRIHGQNPLTNRETIEASQDIRNPPMRDNLDIQRNGLRIASSVVDCSPSDAQDGGVRKWSVIVSDILMGQHMALTGTISCVGIQAPICEGDNLEFDDTVFHIESVIHECSIDQGGRKSWTTSVMLSHGMLSDTSSSFQVDNDKPVYAGLKEDSNMQYNPGLTSDS